jgi:hypothetical protein
MLQKTKRKPTRMRPSVPTLRKKENRDIECHNCHKCGHVKADCWAKEEGPRSGGGSGSG